MKVFLSLFWCVLTAMLMWPGTGVAGEIGPVKAAGIRFRRSEDG